MLQTRKPKFEFLRCKLHCEMQYWQFLRPYLGKVVLPPLSESAFLFGAVLGVISKEPLGVECLGALPVETT